MKYWIPIIALFLCACIVSTPTNTTVDTPTTPTITPAPPTVTSLPTSTLEPTPTPEPSSTPLPPIISISNANQVVKIGESPLTDAKKIAYSSEGKLIAIATGNEANFGVQLRLGADVSELRPISEYTGIVWDVAFSPNDELIATVANDLNNQRLRIWMLVDLMPLIERDGPPIANSLAFSPDGKKLAVGGLLTYPNGIIWIYETDNWSKILELSAPGQNVTALSYTPDGAYLVSSGTDGNIRFWSADNGTLIRTQKYEKQANRLAISPDGTLLATTFCRTSGTYGCEKGGIIVWKMSDGQMITRMDDLAESIAFSPDSSLLLSGSGANDPVVRLHGSMDGTVYLSLPIQSYAVAFSPDGTRFVSADYQTMSLWGLP